MTPDDKKLLETVLPRLTMIAEAMVPAITHAQDTFGVCEALFAGITGIIGKVLTHEEMCRVLESCRECDQIGRMQERSNADQ